MRSIFFILVCVSMIIAEKNFRKNKAEYNNADIAKKVVENFGGDDHDLVAFKIRQLREYLETKSVEELRDYCLKLEEYLNKTTIGGVHDYVRNLDKQGCIQYIFEVTIKHKELLEKTKFESVVGSNVILLMTNGVEPSVNQEQHEQEGGLTDFIFRMDRETLVAWALSTEKYDHEKRGDTSVGGLHDMVHSMSDIELAEYVVEKAKIYKELDSYPKLMELSVKYGYSQKLAFIVSENKLGGLHDYIFSQDRETLISWALAAEKYAFKGKPFVGGIHDMIGSMSDSDIADFILRKVSDFPELDDYEKMTELSKGFNEKKLNFLGSFGGLHDYIFRQPRETLKRWAFTSEKHHRTVKNLHLLGGLEDYIDSLSNSEIAMYILREAGEHEELNSFDNMEKFATKYGFTH